LEYITVDELIKLLEPIKINPPKISKFNKVSIDSREIEMYDIFLALNGEKYDGHLFAEDARRKGAALSIVEREVDTPYILVKDTKAALKKLAGFNLKKNRPKSIAVVGSSGKTTTKDLIHSMLSLKKNSCKTKSNENNWIGVSKTLLSIRDEEYCVVECGTNHKGEMADIANFFYADCAVFTNILKSHIGNFDSLDNILKEKISIAKNKTLCIYNNDDIHLKNAFKNGKKISFSLINPLSEAHILYYSENDDSINFKVSLFRDVVDLNIKNRGINIYNILSALTVSRYYESGITKEEMEYAINSYTPEKYRMQKEILNGVEFILDCYNANPDSMKYAISYFAKTKGRKLLIVSDMLELGKFSRQEHLNIGIFASSFDFDLMAYGESARLIYDKFSDSSKNDAYFFDSKEELTMKLKAVYKNYDKILLKGSRGMKMEEIFYKLKEG